MEIILVFGLLIKSCIVGINGLPSTKMLMILPSRVIVAKENANFKEARATDEFEIGDSVV